MIIFNSVVGDPMLFLTPGFGSGMEKNAEPGSEMNIPDLIFENRFWVKNT
jgi:hypothetical protein